MLITTHNPSIGNDAFNQSSKVLNSRSSNALGSYMHGSSHVSLPRINSVPNMRHRSKTNINKKHRVKASQTSNIENIGQESAYREYEANEPSSLVAALRRELKVAKEGLEQLDDMVDQNIAWVHSNCDTTVLGKISRTGRDKCKKIATGRLYAVVEGSLRRAMFRAVRQWENVIYFDKIRKLARKYALIKSIEMFATAMGDCLSRQLLLGWRPWFRWVQSQKNWEKDISAVEIQRVARGMIVRLFLKDENIRKAVVLIQCLLRKRLSWKKVEKVRKLRAIATARAAKASRKAQRLKDLENSKKKKPPVAVLKDPVRPKSSDVINARRHNAAIKLQKLHRGNAGRVNASEKKREFCARQIQKIVRGKIGRKRFKKVKSENKQSIIGSFLSWGGGGKKSKEKKKKPSAPEKSNDSEGKKAGFLGSLGSFGFGGKDSSDDESVGSRGSFGSRNSFGSLGFGRKDPPEASQKVRQRKYFC